MARAEIYVSTDVEADGPIPGPHSLLSLGSAAFQADGTPVDTFSVNLETLPDATPHPDTMAWWKKQPAAWEACRKDLQPPDQALPRYAEWLEGLPGRPVFVGYPATSDFLFVYWYLLRFAGRSPFGHAGLDIKTFAWTQLGSSFRGTSKRMFPKRWFSDRPHTHLAIDDAIEQGELFCNILREARGAGEPS